MEDPSFAPFREQVEWELDHAKVADVVVIYFAPGTQAPIALLELGLNGASGKVVVVCPEGFWKRGNVLIVCERYGVPVVEDLDALKEMVVERVKEGVARG